MYRCIFVDEKDRDMQRIIWRDDDSAPINHYRLKTITYGTALASFMATQCLSEVAKDIETENPVAASAIRNEF